jgi:hypothetical protein
MKNDIGLKEIFIKQQGAEASCKIYASPTKPSLTCLKLALCSQEKE